MVPCSITCFVATVILVAMVIMMYMAKNDPFVQSYRNSLPDDLKPAYDKIVSERMQIYTTGYIIGFIASALLIALNVVVLKKKMPVSAMVCLAIVVSTVINYFYYILTPKTTLMVNLLKTDKQKSEWTQVYKSMQYYYHSSFVFGAAAVGIYAFAFRGSC